MLKTQIQQWKDLIANGRIDKVIEVLIIYTQSLSDQHYYNAVAQIAARWKANERANLLGTLSNDEYGKERNKISLAVLGVIDELPIPTQRLSFQKEVEKSGSSDFSKGDFAKLLYEKNFEELFQSVIAKAENRRDQSIYYQAKGLYDSWNLNNRMLDLNPQGFPDFTDRQNNILKKLETLNDQMEEQKSVPLQNDTATPAPTTPNKTDLWKKIGYIGLILGILASAVKIFEFCNKPSIANDEAMQLTVFVQGVDKKPIDALQNVGSILVRYGNASPDMLIGQGGRCNFGEIPNEKRNQDVDIVLIADGYEPVFPEKKYKMDGKPVYFLVQRDNSLGLIQGIVKNRSGFDFIAGALVMIDNDTTVYTDSLGRFRLQLPVSKQRDTYSISVKKDGFATKSEYFKPRTGAMEVRLDRR